jgi:ComF family protein
MFNVKPGDLFGDACLLCGLSAKGARICAPCLDVMPRNDCFCPCCGQPVTTRQPDGVKCAACQRKQPLFELARAPFHYAFPVDAALKKMKFRRQLAIAPAFAELLLPVLHAEFSHCDALVPVPLHRWRHVTRGFNQARELCKPLSKDTNLPVLDSVVRVKATGSQSGLSASERRRNLHGAFVARHSLPFRHPVIIDDVITTGTTSGQLAQALFRAGASSVGVLAVAYSSTL